MVNFKLKNLFGLFTVVVIGMGIFSVAKADFVSDNTPTGCDPLTMSTTNLSPLSGIPTSLSTKTIYVLDSGEYLISSTINTNGNCISIVASGTVTLKSTIADNTLPMIDSEGFDSILIKGITIDGANFSDVGIFIGGTISSTAKNIIIDSVKVNGTKLESIYFWNVTGSIVTGTTITAPMSDNAGIYLYGSTNNTLTNNTIYSNTDGISIQGGSNNNILINNAIYDNLGQGINISNSSNTIINGGYISGNDYNGIYTEMGSTHTQITNTEISYNGNGIYFWNTTGNIITNASIHNNTFVGIYFYSGSNNNTITSSQIDFNTDGILIVNGSNNNTLTSNSVYSNTNDGITIKGGSTNNTLTNNTIYSNSSNGILIQNLSNNNIFTNNSISKNNQGIDIDGSLSNSITGGYITGNTLAGILLENNSSSTQIVNTDISYNSLNGIYFWNTTGNTISNANIHNNIGVGIYFYAGSDNNTINNNTMVSNNTSGILLYSASNNTINLSNNTNGIYLQAGSNANKINNTQIIGENKIYLYDICSGNIITGGVFSTATTTTTGVTISLQNSLTNSGYTISGAGISGIYTGYLTSNPMNKNIEITTGYGIKAIIVTYANGNKYYDSINYPDPGTVTPPSGGTPSGGGGGGGSYTPSCKLSELICVNGKYKVITGKTCDLGTYANKQCSVSTGTINQLIGSIKNSPYSTELNNAYLRAYKFGITTMPTIQQADMKGQLSRKHLAKMISNFAINVVGIKVDTGVKCNFTDMSKESAEMKLYAQISCQLGIMGLQSDGTTPAVRFNPNDIVSRAQFGTVLSRLIRGDTYNDGTKYYTAHLQALKKSGIMTKIDEKPTLVPEIRRRVMLMLMRTYEQGFFN